MPSEKPPKHLITRRQALKVAAATAAASNLGFPNITQAQSSKKLRLAMIGVANQAWTHHRWMAKESVTALCDADTRYFDMPIGWMKDRPNSAPSKRFSRAKKFQDYRELFERPDLFDAVMICTPDHTHYSAAVQAIKLGKSVYCEKPLTWSPGESLELKKLAEENQVATQLGNQGMGSPGWRKAYTFYHAGLIGQVHTAHAWSPLQGNGNLGTAGSQRKVGDDPVPSGVDWNAWIGRAPMRAYVNGEYHPRKWRQTVDFGNGILGDWCCHKLNAVFLALEPGMPTKVWNEAITDWHGETWPTGRRVCWQFAAGETTRTGTPKPRAAFKMVWHDGNAKPTHADIPDWPKDQPIPEHGVVMIGDRGTIHVEGTHNGNASLLPLPLQQTHGKMPIDKALPNRNHHQEFVDAAKGLLAWDAPLSNFTHGGHMTAVSLMGNLALRLNQSLAIDTNGKITNVASNNAAMFRTPREGWY